MKSAIDGVEHTVNGMVIIELINNLKPASLPLDHQQAT